MHDQDSQEDSEEADDEEERNAAGGSTAGNSMEDGEQRTKQGNSDRRPPMRSARDAVHVAGGPKPVRKVGNSVAILS